MVRWRRSPYNPNYSRDVGWGQDEDLLLYFVKWAYDDKAWMKVATHFLNRTEYQVRDRWMRSRDPLIVHEKWTPEEDSALWNAVVEHGVGKWTRAADMVPGRTDATCRQRWFQLSSSTRVQNLTHLPRLTENYNCVLMTKKLMPQGFQQKYRNKWGHCADNHVQTGFTASFLWDLDRCPRTILRRWSAFVVPPTTHHHLHLPSELAQGYFPAHQRPLTSVMANMLIALDANVRTGTKVTVHAADLLALEDARHVMESFSTTSGCEEYHHVKTMLLQQKGPLRNLLQLMPTIPYDSPNRFVSQCSTPPPHMGGGGGGGTDFKPKIGLRPTG